MHISRLDNRVIKVDALCVLNSLEAEAVSSFDLISLHAYSMTDDIFASAACFVIEVHL